MDGDCSHEIERCLLLGRKTMANLDSVLKGRDITFKAMLFPVVMYGYESWTIKKAERWRIGAFEQRCLKRLLRVPWTAKRSNQSILKEINPEYSLVGLMLKSQYFGYLMRRAYSLEICWERLKAGGEAGNRGKDGWMASPTHWLWPWANSEDSGWQARLVHEVTKSWTRLSDWTTKAGRETAKVLDCI